jgi:hypothetical protein
MLGGNAAFQLLLSLETQPIGNNHERRITDRRISANGFDLRLSDTGRSNHFIIA